MNTNRKPLTVATATVGAIVYKGNGNTPLRIAGTYTGEVTGIVFVRTVKASTATDAGANSGYPVSAYTVRVA